MRHPGPDEFKRPHSDQFTRLPNRHPGKLLPIARHPLINAGSTTADQIGLYEFTTQTNQVKETNSVVDIGYHYVATDAYGQPLATLWLGVPDYLADPNGDGALEQWEMYYFGQTGLDPNASYDGQGSTLMYDYQNDIYPNVIQFTIEVTNNYVNLTNVPVQVNLSSGIPGFIAISVDDTNYVNDAIWQASTGTNVSVSLAALPEGWHGFWLGLKGTATNAVATWEYKRLKLDLTPPSLVITNPSFSTLTQPMIQLQGYSPEALDRISYDLTNALGLATNLQVLIRDQYYDPMNSEFTTNSFQAYDVPLTNGVNTLILHATDMAGNLTTTNISFTVDYSSKPSPTIQLFWPLNGGRISGSSFNWRGWVDDPTASVSATLVATNGCTNIISGLVERNGNFWVQNLPMPNGTNLLTLTVTDAAGNISTTNITVSTCPLTITMTPIPNDQLWYKTVTASGGISDSTYSLWINGVKSVVSSGTWTATNVPMTPGGVALFNVTTYAPGETQPDGSHGN